ncbi:MAG: phosphotransferase [Tateyamaria sp.]|uniref:phosphotransferase n=1 Tax=Tateyamaria sp. TaxID=1929288 RepID=UPI0032860564
MLFRDDLRQSAHDAFIPLAVQAGVDPKDYTVGAEWIKDDTNRLHIVQRYDGPDGARVVLKHALRPVDKDGFGAILEAHQKASTALSGHDVAGVPEVLAKDEERQSYLMSFFPGETFLNLCRKNEDHGPFLHSAGAWLGAYHAATFVQERPFQPKFMLRHMHRLSGQVERGERKILGQKRFVSLARDMGSYAQDADGHPGKVSSKHGDLNAHNILIDGTRAVALDFLAPSTAPVGYDIAHFLLSYVQMVGDLDSLPKGHVLPPDAMQAFFEGYGNVLSNDPMVHFLMRVQILTDWNRMSDKKTLSSVMRFERIKKIARRAFA